MGQSVDVDVYRSGDRHFIRKHDCSPASGEVLLGTAPLPSKLAQRRRIRIEGCKKVYFDTTRDSELLDYLRAFIMIL